MNLGLNPISKDLNIKQNEDAVKESLKTLILTNRGERLFQPNIGSDIKGMLFENNTPVVLKLLKEKIRETIETYEPRVNLVDIDVTSNIDDNRIAVTIFFNVRNVEETIKTTIFLERTR